MKNTLPILLLLLLLSACKTPRYHYVSPSLNNTAYSGAGAGQVGVQFGSIGLGAKGGLAVSENINLNAFVGGFPSNGDEYSSTESEFSIGFQTGVKKNAVTSFFLGLGLGNNDKEKIGLSGNYNRPFIQVQRAIHDKPIFSGNVYIDASIGLRLNYLLYNGRINANEFDHSVLYSEPYMGFSIGGKRVRFELLQGATIKTSGTWAEGLRIFPYFGNLGIQVKFGKSK